MDLANWTSGLNRNAPQPVLNIGYIRFFEQILKKYECSVEHINNEVKLKLLGNANILVQIRRRA